ncbi:uncharacterized protein LOC128389160 [Panonychus citri]|uniref:uncharacterized protein LOC128389160 n=1 Tax=Panonychus citri TaxID=50023 RepID=UPI00230788D2|nr:uncharacterized protein LOC128389160 [Panonychus citri]XP_053204666.1 uncharacterized protein LOC128389160 [Panonychus citri]XP_053204667.1 uncharacterized protein LOC128389160 [Panonychus citri]XP_053204668.1 uncharacterized protein LOC128389160 [Panonychus citri]
MSTRIADELTCLVCSDKAMGNNFGAVSCESCKAFFRRNAHDIEKLRCEFTGKCSITTLTRRHCRRCRLEKCYHVGMRKDWILTEEQLQIRRARIQSRKSRELATRTNVNSVVSSSSVSTSSSPSLLSSSCSSSSLALSLPNHHHVISSSFSSSSSSTNIEQVSSVFSSCSSTNFHHANQQNHSMDHNSTPFIGPMTFCLSSGPSTLNASNGIYDEDDEEDGEDEESDNDYTELCDKMGQKTFPIPNSYSRNMLTSLLDDNSQVHHQPLHELYSSSSINPSHHYSDFDQISSTSMVPNVPSFLSQPEYHHHHQNDNKHHSSFTVPSNSPSLYPFSSSSSSSSSSFSSNHHLPGPVISSFPYNDSRSSTSSNSFHSNFTIKPELSDFNQREDENIQSKVYDLITGSDLNLPISLSNEYISSNLALNQLLDQRMNELKLSYSNHHQSLPFICEVSTTLEETIIQLADHIAKSSIASIKSLTPFGRLPIQVRNDMFKGSFANLMIIRLCFLFDLDKGGWTAPGSSKVIKWSFLNLDSQSASYFLNFIKDLNERWQRDFKIGLILEAITLFSLNSPDMKYQENISKEKYFYTYLLRRYLESIGLSVGQARADCYELLMKLETIKVNVEPLDKIRQICSYQPLKAGQLLSEILDLV